METKYKLFYSKYPFNQESVVNRNILYKGSIKNCYKNLLEVIKEDTTKYKFIIIWTQNK